jgi:hypothetical protein
MFSNNERSSLADHETATDSDEFAGDLSPETDFSYSIILLIQTPRRVDGASTNA